METIISYIDNIFSSYPDVSEVRKAREDLLSIMEDKYNELKSEGKSENEAVGIVISEFGNIEEITAELGITPLNKGGEEEEYAELEKEKFSLEQARNYIETQKSFGRKIAIGVMLCILSPVCACVLDPLAEAGFLPVRITDTIGVLALFGMVAIAVAIFIISGIANSKYERLEKKQIILDYGTKQLMTEQYEKQNRRFGTEIAVGVVLCIFSIIPLNIAEVIFEDTKLAWVSDMAGASLFAFVAVAVYLFITAGVRQSAYEVLLGIGEHSPEKIMQKEKSVLRIISAIYWPVVVCIYLGWSFITMDWEITWIIWPVTGVLFGAIAAVIGVIEGMKK
ncbi:MAG: hypothetical protein J6A75_06490 [Lachnospiraceae bacterium]|nr:hypothetical protein [Lachnospiraceae bacterium]